MPKAQVTLDKELNGQQDDEESSFGGREGRNDHRVFEFNPTFRTVDLHDCPHFRNDSGRF